MLPREPVFQSGDPVRIWQKFCGFLDLSLGEFMEIQKGLLMEQIGLIADSPLGKKIIKGKIPSSTEEFQKVVPLTTYEDYESYIGDCKEDSLNFKPEVWAHTSGRGGRFKWIPYSEQGLEKFADGALASLILATAERRGEVNIREGSRFFSILAPSPYMSGISSWLYAERFGLKLIPPPEISEKLEFRERMETGFQMALRSGVDIVGALGSVLVKMGERFTEHSQGMRFSLSLLHPTVLFHICRGVLKSKIQRRAILPLDLWPAKGFVCSGTDVSVYKNKIKYYWGKIPHEVYGFTEAGVIAVQSWIKQGLTFFPFSAFYEFIPEDEWLKSVEDKNYKPSTVLLSQLEVGKIYELVVTNFHAMPFLRYRVGDLLKVISLEEKETGISLPQFRFHSRGDGLIDLYNIVRLDERAIWQALNDTNIGYEDWSARKEYETDSPIVHIYVELKQDIRSSEMERLLNDHLRATNTLYEEAIGEAETNPLRVTILPRGSFQRYYEARRKEGADLAHLKPPHMNANNSIIQDLIYLNREESNRENE